VHHRKRLSQRVKQRVSAKRSEASQAESREKEIQVCASSQEARLASQGRKKFKYASSQKPSAKHRKAWQGNRAIWTKVQSDWDTKLWFMSLLEVSKSSAWLALAGSGCKEASSPKKSKSS
jgi:hypothetical protein